MTAAGLTEEVSTAALEMMQVAEQKDWQVIVLIFLVLINKLISYPKWGFKDPNGK